MKILLLSYSRLVSPFVILPFFKIFSVFGGAGIKVDQPITGVCNGGMSSSTVALTAYLLGNQNAAVYLVYFKQK